MDEDISELLFISMKVTICVGEISLEHQVGKFHSTSVGCECALPVLSNIKAVKRSFGPDVLEGDICHIAGAPRICLDEPNVITLYDRNVASMLPTVSVSLWEESGIRAIDHLRCSRSQR